MKSLTVVSANQNVTTQKPSGLLKVIAELEEIETIAQHEMRVTAGLYADVHNGEQARKELVDAVHAANAYLKEDEYRDSGTAIVAATEYATDDEIGRELKQLLGSWPNSSKADLAIFGALLTVEVRAKALSRFALRAACRKLRTTAKFLPVIAEVLEAVTEAENRIQRIAQRHRELPEQIASSQRILDYYAAQFEQEAKARVWKQATLARSPSQCERCERVTDRIYAFSECGDGSDGECLCWTCYMPARANRA